MHRIDLPSLGPGSPMFILKHVFDGGVNTKSAYIQAGMHANEQPSLLVANHLLKLLARLDSESKILGRVVVTPYANPIGLAQKVLGEFPGRFYLQDGTNFNRSFPAIDDGIRNAVSARSYSRNDIGAFKELFQFEITKVKAVDPAAFLKKTLLQEAFKHDVVIDLHCANKSVLFVVGKSKHASRVLALAQSVCARAVVLEERLAGSPIDESFDSAWETLRELGLVDEEHQGFVAVIEHRGQADMMDDVAHEDAIGIIRFLAKEGLVQWNEDAEHAIDTDIPVYPFAGNEHVYCEATGLIVFHKKPGEMVAKGDKYAEIVQLDSQLDSERIPVLSNIDGMVIDTHRTQVVRAGQKIAWLAGHELLSDPKNPGIMGP